MNDPNYDDFHDFHQFLDDVFKEIDEDDAPICRNLDCPFTDKVLEYLCVEWEVDVGQYPHDIQTKAMDVIDNMKGDSIPNVAGKIAMEILPI